MVKPEDIKIGTKYSPMGKTYVCTVVDIYKTYNASNELVKTAYISTYDFCGQVSKREDCVVTIQRGFLE